VTTLDDLISRGDVPEPLRSVLLGFPWRLDRMLALDLPVEVIRINDFRWLLDLPFWRKDETWFTVTPNQVRERRLEHEDHWTRTLRADLTCPVHITEREGRAVIADGIHRLLKADVHGLATLPARRIPSEMLPMIALSDRPST
jgi:hypothetical protein